MKKKKFLKVMGVGLLMLLFIINIKIDFTPELQIKVGEEVYSNPPPPDEYGDPKVCGVGMCEMICEPAPGTCATGGCLYHGGDCF